MNIPVNIGMWFLAALPIIVLLYLMAGKQWGANKAAPLGLLIALFNAFVFYRADFTLISFEIFKGFWSAFAVLLVVWPAILLYEVVSEAKAFTVFRNGLKKVTPNELIQVIAIGWVFTSFLQGITGFGVPVAVGAPLLLGLGVKPIYAVVIPLIGHAWANTFGTLSVAWDALVLQTNLSENPELLLQTALWAAIFIWIFNIITGLAICWLYGKKEGVKKGFVAVLIISLIHGGGQIILTQINQTLAAFIPASIALIVVFALSKTKRYGKSWKLDESPIMNRDQLEENLEDYPKDMGVHQAFFPYYVLTFITLFVLLVMPVRNFLGQFRIGFSFPETATGYGYINPGVQMFSPIALLIHAGIFLILSSAIGFFFYYKNGWIKKTGGKEVWRRSWQKTIPSSIAVIGFIVMSRIMGGTGQTLVLAQGIAVTLGVSYVVFSPLVGLLGSFMTSSNMASNILFGEFQLTTAQILNVNVAPVLGAQTAGGAIGNTLSPGNIILGTTTAGILGQEGIILKKIIPIAVSAAIIVGAILFVTIIL
ncbi:MAG: L-lactate permease [Candidatus Izemoplasmataceae bacterium]|jgi:lactate permease